MAERKVSWIISANISQWEKNLDRAQRQMDRFGRNMQRMGRSFSTYITAPVVTAGAAAVKMASDFDSSFAKIEGLVGVSRAELQGMRGDVLRLAGETSRAPQELAEALFFVTSAGLRGAEAIQVLEASARASAAGLGEAKTVADLVTSAMNAYGAENLSAAQATDILVGAVREGKAEAPELAQSLGQVLPIAAELGVTFDQVGASVAAMTRTGTNAATASTQLRAIMTALIKPTQGAENALQQMGTSSAMLRSQLREEGLVSVLGFLREQMDQNGDAMAQVFPNIRALSGALDIMGGNAEENVAIFQRMTNTTGSLDRAFNTVAQTTEFKFNQAISSLKANAIEMGEIMLPVVNKMLDVVIRLANQFAGLSRENRKQIVLWGGVAAAIGPALIAMGSFVRIAAFALTPLKGMLAVVRNLTRAFFAVMSPIALKIAAIAALALVAKSLWDTFEPLQNFFKKLWDGIAKSFEVAINFIIDSWNTVRSFMARVIPGISEAAVNSVSWMNDQTSGKLGEFTDNVQKNFSAALGYVTDFASGARSAIQGFTNSLFEGGSGGGLGEATEEVDGFSRSVQAMSFLVPSRISEMAKAMVQPVESVQRQFEATKMKAIDMGQALQTVVSGAIMDFAETIGNAFTGDAGAKGFFNNILIIVADFGKQLGRMLIAAGVAAQAFKTLLVNPVGAIIAGGALIAASTAVRNLLSKGPAGNVQSVNDALITSSGKVIEFHPDDNILAMKNLGNLGNMGGGGGSPSPSYAMINVNLDSRLVDRQMVELKYKRGR